MFSLLKAFRMALLAMLSLGMVACQTVEPPSGKGKPVATQKAPKKTAAQIRREKEQAKLALGLFALAAGAVVLGAAGSSGPSYRPAYRQGRPTGGGGRVSRGGGCAPQYGTPTPGQGWGAGNFCQ